MSVWIKICGNTSLADARLAVDAGANAVGFVFAPSPRHVTVSEVAAIVAHLPATVEKIGVFVDAGFEEIYSTVRSCGLTGVQLHFEAASALPAKIHERLGAALVETVAVPAEYALFEPLATLKRRYRLDV